MGSFRHDRSPFGVFDLAGNVREWVADLYGPYSPLGQVDPRGPSSGTRRVVRGGGWESAVWFCQAAWRDGLPPATRQRSLGFRLAR
ncbi:MAG: hypothetical protein D6731_04680 [Planctomycetota bacterium]|nr:MAG: hypothetical protein D6731_04680 [Planctomycetota bacterium]